MLRGSARTSAAPAGETSLTGSPAARRLYQQVAADPGADLRLDVVGVSGSGKSVLLDALAERFAHPGAVVHRLRPGLEPAPDDPDAVLLVDDAHLLPDATLAGIRTRLATTGEPRRVVVAHRPWPRSPELAALGADLARGRAPLVLGNLDRTGVAGRAAMHSEGRPTTALVDYVFEQTGGLPLLVDRLLNALREADPRRPDWSEPPRGLIEQLSYELDRLPEPVLRLTLAFAVGAPLDGEVLAPLLDLPAAEVAELTEQARAAGLLDSAGELRPLQARAALRRTPAVHRLAVRRQLAEIQLEQGGSVLAAAQNLLDTGASGERIASVFTAAADEALAEHPAMASRLLDAAIEAGAPTLPLAARGAEAAARAGDLDRALELADQVLSASGEVPEADRARAVSVAAAALAQRGLLARSAELYRWLGASALGANAVVAVPALLGTGALAEARALLQPGSGPHPSSAHPHPALTHPPTLIAGAEALLARGVYDTITGSPTAALSQLARAAALLEPTARAVLLPDTPAALAALVAAHCGELDVARSVLDRAVAIGLGGRAAAARHRLLQAWIAMSSGATGVARTLLAEVDDPSKVLEPRDELVAAALEVGLARRAGDLAALMTAWSRAREAIVRHPVDLYVLQPLGELIVASARLREQTWVRPHLDEAHALLSALDYPVLWSASLYWSELHAAIAAENWPEAGLQAERLEEAAPHSRYAAAMAVAARSWLAVMRDGKVDPAAVDSAARGLHAVGLSWDGGKLAGQGAIRTPDRKAMSALLACARGLQNAGQNAAAPPPNTGPAPQPAAAAVSPVPGRAPDPRPAAPVAPPTRDGAEEGTLSDREREVAELVLDGLTYKQIGERLFISAKTVEHHVARMRQRLGSNSRGELIAQLRLIVQPAGR
ncbi:helix-turn-helix transcriptional regulator [Pseudonocardia eucalypti]|uniref:Helix-turn-helix transcriptional regulator n=1 Tax=Pseudonocardia eucalypti TaxID=648755 RepID=A0ABP9PEG8_9PSEU|nr:DNA-binding CsgD family transcriptional regulator/tetratricopeptide (TPR) repeat protein [Pseudonocardia eucalypti]